MVYNIIFVHLEIWLGDAAVNVFLNPCMFKGEALKMSLKNGKHFSILQSYYMSSVFANSEYCILALPHLFGIYICFYHI